MPIKEVIDRILQHDRNRRSLIAVNRGGGISKLGNAIEAKKEALKKSTRTGDVNRSSPTNALGKGLASKRRKRGAFKQAFLNKLNER